MGIRAFGAVAVVGALALSAGSPSASGAQRSLTAQPATPPIAGAVAGTYAAPLPAPLDVLRGFAPPATPYGPGHLGVDLLAAPGAAVHAPADGTVQFAGSVAGRGVVVIMHSDGVSTEYEPVHPAVTAGQQVRRGELLGTLQGRHAGCPESCLHWGARHGARYLDPLALLVPLGPVVLLPWTTRSG
jgi:murein DD-endopeptidase MepM/ murein hydrolase activator NlpD